jgi:NAD(P) transhydrogenase
MNRDEYNLVVIGAGPAGLAAARKAAFFGYHVALVDQMKVKLTPLARLRRIMHKLSALQNEGVFPALPVKWPTDDDSSAEAAQTREFMRDVLKYFRDDSFDEKEEINALKKRIQMRNIETIEGSAKFLNLDEIELDVNGQKRIIGGSHVIISTGSGLYHPPDVKFDELYIHDAKSIFNIEQVPESIAIFGTYLAACQFAIIFALLGTRVDLIVEEKELFSEIDEEIHQSFLKSFNEYGINVTLGNKLVSAIVDSSSDTPFVTATTAGNYIVESGLLLYTAAHAGNTKFLDCGEAGVETDELGNVIVDKNYCTTVPHIYAVGDVIKLPSVESTRANQGRVAVNHMFGFKDAEQLSDGYPLGIYLIPEMAMFGHTEKEVKATGIQYVVGRSNYNEIPFGSVAGIHFGLMKIIAAKDTEEILGVHVIGRSAHEIIHYGMHLVEDRVTLGKVVGSVFNGSTLHELYTYAALDAVYKLRK